MLLVGTPESHKGCRLNEAHDNNKTICITYPGPQGKAYGYWIPLASRPDWILHFGVGLSATYDEFKTESVIQVKKFGE